MLSTAAPTAPPSSTLLLHHNRRRRGRYLDSHLYPHPSPLSPRRPRSHHLLPHSSSPSSPLRFDRPVSPLRSPSKPAMGDYRHMRSGSLNIPSQGSPSGAAAGASAVPAGGAAPGLGPAQGRFDGPRSPPSTYQFPPPQKCVKRQDKVETWCTSHGTG